MSVFLDPGITDDERVAVRAALEATYERQIEYFDRDLTFAEAQKLFADSPHLLESLDPDDLPTSFRLSIADDETPIEDANIGALPGVREVVDRLVFDEAARWWSTANRLDALAHLWERPHDVLVFLQVYSTDADLADIEDLMSDINGLVGLTVVDRAASAEEFERFASWSSEQLQPLPAEDLPPSVRAYLSSPTAGISGVASLKENPVVRDVVYKSYDPLSGLGADFGHTRQPAKPSVLDDDLSTLAALSEEWANSGRGIVAPSQVLSLDQLIAAQEGWAAIRDAAVDDCDLTPNFRP